MVDLSSVLAFLGKVPSWFTIIKKAVYSPQFDKARELFNRFSKSQKRIVYSLCVLLMGSLMLIGGLHLIGTMPTHVVFTVVDSGRPVAGASVSLGKSDKECQTTDINGNVFFTLWKRNDSYIVVAEKKGFQPNTFTFKLKDSSAQKQDIPLIRDSLKIRIVEPSDGASLETTGLTQIPVSVEFCDQDGKQALAPCKEIGLQFGRTECTHACADEKITRLTHRIPYNIGQYGLEDNALKVILGGVSERCLIGFHREFTFANLAKDRFKKLHSCGIVEKDGHINFELRESMSSNEVVAPQILSCEKPITIETRAAFLNGNASIVISIGKIYQVVLGEKNRNTLIVKKFNSYSNPPKWEAKEPGTQIENILPINTPLSIKMRIEKIYNNSAPKLTMKISYPQDSSRDLRAIDVTEVLPVTEHTLDKTVSIGIGAYLETQHPSAAVRFDYLRMSNSSMWTVNN